MKLKDMVRETIDSGITPIVLCFEEVRFFGSRKRCLRTSLEIESLDIGHLTYKQYRFVARRTKIGNAMVKRHMEKLLRAIYFGEVNIEEYEFITIPVYARLLSSGDIFTMLRDAFTAYPEITPDKLCIELSADILYEDIKMSREAIAGLRELGVRVAIFELGDEFCPLFRISELDFDIAFADEFAAESLGGEDAVRVAGSLAAFMKLVGVPIIVPQLTSSELIAAAENMSFDGYTSYLSVGGDAHE